MDSHPFEKIEEIIKELTSTTEKSSLAEFVKKEEVKKENKSE